MFSKGKAKTKDKFFKICQKLHFQGFFSFRYCITNQTHKATQEDLH